MPPIDRYVSVDAMRGMFESADALDRVFSEDDVSLAETGGRTAGGGAPPSAGGELAAAAADARSSDTHGMVLGGDVAQLQAQIEAGGVGGGAPGVRRDLGPMGDEGNVAALRARFAGQPGGQGGGKRNRKKSKKKKGKKRRFTKQKGGTKKRTGTKKPRFTRKKGGTKKRRRTKKS